MKLPAALFKERLAAAIECAAVPAAEAAKPWTAERVSEYLRARLDTEQPEDEQGGRE